MTEFCIHFLLVEFYIVVACRNFDVHDCNGFSPCVSQRKLYNAQFVLSGYKICPDTSFMQFAFVTVYPLCCTYGA